MTPRFIDETGVMVPLVAGILLAILIVLGLAVDSGTLYNGQLAAQSAVDAAVVSGAAILAEKGTATDESTINSSMSGMLRANLGLKGIPVANIVNEQFSADVATGLITGTLSVNVNLRIFRLLPGFARLGLVHANARAEVKPATVSLMLDTSFSMCCSSLQPLCNPVPNCPLAGSKMDELQQAVVAFLSHFDPNRDTINLVPYALGAEVVVPFRAPGGGFPKVQIEQEVNALRPGGATNLCDAFLRSYLDSVRVNSTKNAAFVLFSDGSPTAARMLLGEPNAIAFGGNPNNPYNFPDVKCDYLSWSLFTDPPRNSISAPYYFVYTPDLSIWNPRLHYDALPPSQATVVRTGYDDLGDPLETFSTYTLSPAIAFPDGQVVRQGRAWEDGTTATFSWSRFDYRETYFNCALSYADMIRQKGAAWFVVGLGPPAPSTIDVNGNIDPYQNVENDFDRKDIFLARLAYDFCGFARGDPSFPGFPTYVDLLRSGDREGLYLGTPDAAELKSIFETIARRVKLRLIQ